MLDNVLDFIVFGYVLNMIAFFVAFLNLLATAIFDFGSIIQANRTMKKRNYFWRILIPYYTAYRLFSLYSIYGVKHSFNAVKMLEDRDNNER